MSSFQSFGKVLIIIGATVMLLGVMLMFRVRLPWLGRLPGDIYIKREGFQFYFPLTTSILISLILSLLLRFFRR